MDIRATIRQTLERNGALNLEPGIRWVWNNRLTSTMGRYFPINKGHRQHRKSGLVEFSTVLHGRATDEQRAENVAHEICHLIVDHQNPGADAHGLEWQRAMLRAGFEPKRCHEVPVQHRAQARVRLYCGCPDGVVITKSLFTRTMRNGEWQGGRNTRRWCKRCREHIRYSK